MENWKPVPEEDFASLYEVSDQGNIRSLCGRYKNKSNILKPSKGSKGYLIVTLCNGEQQKSCSVHKLVARAFIPNPNNYPCINHKDENKENNSVSNLEWCSYYYNNVYGSRLTKSALKKSIPVLCIENNHIYASARAAARETGIQQSGICQCCNNKRKTAGGFHWRFLNA